VYIWSSISHDCTSHSYRTVLVSTGCLLEVQDCLFYRVASYCLKQRFSYCSTDWTALVDTKWRFNCMNGIKLLELSWIWLLAVCFLASKIIKHALRLQWHIQPPRYSPNKSIHPWKEPVQETLFTCFRQFALEEIPENPCTSGSYYVKQGWCLLLGLEKGVNTKWLLRFFKKELFLHI
jgi:hypothetical protein